MDCGDVVGTATLGKGEAEADMVRRMEEEDCDVDCGRCLLIVEKEEDACRWLESPE